MTHNLIFGLIPPAVGTLAGVIGAELLRANAVVVSSSVVTTIAISVILIFFLEELFRGGAGAIVDTRWFRRIVLRSEYFEGQWIDEVTVNDGPIGYGVLTIVHTSGDNVTFEGVNYNRDGGNIGAFESELAKIIGRRLIYMYTGPPGSDRLSNSGRGEIQFTASSFTGGFFDIKNKRWHNVEGKRLLGEDATQAASGDQATLKRLLATHFPHPAVPRE